MNRPIISVIPSPNPIMPPNDYAYDRATLAEWLAIEDYVASRLRYDPVIQTRPDLEARAVRKDLLKQIIRVREEVTRWLASRDAERVGDAETAAVKAESSGANQ